MKASVFLFKPAEADQIEGNIGGKSEAIKHAIDIARTGDIVLVLGKGNETYQKLKDRVIYFNDVEEAVKSLKERLNKIAV